MNRRGFLKTCFGGAAAAALSVVMAQSPAGTANESMYERIVQRQRDFEAFHVREDQQWRKAYKGTAAKAMYDSEWDAASKPARSKAGKRKWS